ncbi:MAG TPA: hypothetical protein VHQ47_09995 [Phycisphaerae bacterium]|nr:hypothetical protein [Phycisphaerae bacterium]
MAKTRVMVMRGAVGAGGMWMGERDSSAVGGSSRGGERATVAGGGNGGQSGIHCMGEASTRDGG